KFPGADPLLTTAMKSVGEAMAVGRNFKESIQKALRSLETGLSGFDEVEVSAEDVKEALNKPTHDRLLVMAQALRLGLSVEEIHSRCKIDPWFIEQIKDIVEIEKTVQAKGLPHDAEELYRLKGMGFSDKRLAKLAGKKSADVAALRGKLQVHPVY